MVQPAYEQSRQKRLEENRKRMEALKLPQLSQALRHASAGPTTPPMKPRKPRTLEKTKVQVRRSSRMANRPAPIYVEVAADRVIIPRRVSKPRDLSGRVYASDEERAYSIEKAEEVLATFDAVYPSFVKSMLPSHVSGGFWLGLNVSFCKRYLPKRDSEITLIDEDGEGYPTIYLPRKTGLSGGWKGFSVAHDLVDGDALVFQLIKPTSFKVYITRVSGFKTNKQP